MSSATLLATSLTRGEPDLDRQFERAVAAGADIVELRVDRIGDSAALSAFLARPRTVPIILTVRSRDEGGAFDGDDAERVALIERLGLLMPGFVDVEFATWSRSANLRQKINLVADAGGPAEGVARLRNRLILSRHELSAEPPDLDAVYKEMAAQPAFAIKIVFAARDARDSIRALELLQRRAAERPLVVIAMGEAGLASRVLCRKFGAWLTFAAPRAGDESAPGQPTIEEAIGNYRWRSIGRATRVFGVVGWPVGHSLSPRLHNSLMAQDGIDGVYVPFPVEPTPGALHEFLDAFPARPWLDVAGLSVTIPHKQAALEWLRLRGAAAGRMAQRCGAVNTLTRRPDGSWHGENTDAPALSDALVAAMGGAAQSLAGKTAAVLGAGGAGRAAVAALLEARVRVTVCNRTDARAAELADAFGCRWEKWERRESLAADIVVNATSVGLAPKVDESPLPPKALRAGMLVFDSVYRPAETRLLREARAAGCTVVSGVELFIRQAARQYGQWHGRTPELGWMRRFAQSFAGP